ncbi:MAG: putative acyl-CoA dehydrogenase FadE17 [Caulobacter sp.]|nr:putative acyl-CoA dehydrogenase FadE17 [Caulobacter sp.]
MNLDFTPDESAFRAEARAWLQDNVPRGGRATDGEHMLEFDREWQQRQYAGGWAGVSWPVEYGGRGLSLIQQLIWYEEYARADAPLPVASAYFVALSHAGPTVIARGSEWQKSFFLPKILTGETVWCQGFSEPGAGSDLAGLRTRAVVDGDHLVVNGSKIWTSRAQHAKYQELLVRTDPDAGSKHSGITWVIGDMTLPGIDIRPIPCMHGASHFCQVFYDNVRIPLEHVVGEIGDGWNVAMATLGFERGTASLAEQIMMSRVVERLIELAHTELGPDGVRPAIQDDEIATRLATLRAEVAALKAMSYTSISRAQRNFVPGSEGTIIGCYNSEMLQRIFRMAADLLGPEMLDRDSSDENWVYEYHRSIMTTIGGGTSEIRRNIIGERVLGLPRDR